MKTHLLFRCWTAILLAAFASAASAQEPDDFSFAKRLAYRGWFDLASDICARIEGDRSLPRDARSALPILMAEIELAKADRESDPKKALEFMSGSITKLQKFIADEPNHPRIFEAQINIGYLKSRKAKALVDQLDTAKTAEEHDRLRQEAAALYKEITADFEKCAQDWKRIQPSSPEIDGGIMDARLEADRARYENARIPGLDAEDRKGLLTAAIKNLVDFEIDYGDTAKAFEAMLLEGRCLFELGELPQAETKLKNTMGLLDILVKEGIARNDYFDQIIFGAYLTTAQVQLKTNRAKDAKAFIDEKLASDKRAASMWIALALKVEKVEALYRLKEFVAARNLAEEVIKADPTGPFGAKMKERLATLGNRGPGNVVDPAQAIPAAEGLMDKGRLRDAMATLRQAVEACRTEELRAKHAPRALFLMGQCLQDMRRPLEAALVYEKVFSQFPSNEVAVKACWEAVVCYSNEFDTFEDPADEREKDRLMQTLLDRWKGAKEADNIPYLQGLKLENAKKFKEAAEKYLMVPERAPAYERALVRGAYCLRADAFRVYAALKGKGDAAAHQPIIDQLNRAEGLFKKFLDRVDSPDHRPEGPEAARDRASLVVVVNQELAFLYNHKLIGRAKDALAFLDKVAKDMPADDDRMAKIHQLQIQSQLVLNMNDEAVKTMELLFDRFPHARETAEACKLVAITLDEIIAGVIKGLPPGAPLPEAAKENLKKVSRYYGKWLDGAIRFSMNASVNDVMAVGANLYLTAKQLNNLPDSVQSFMDLKKGMIVAYKNYFEEAEFVHGLLVSDRFKTAVPPKERMSLMTRRARCQSFISDSADSWNRAKGAYEDIVKEYGIKDAKGAFQRAALIEKPLLIGPYLELGAVYCELGRWTKIHYDNAISTFADVSEVSAQGGEPWWISRYMIILSHFRRGKEKDIMTAQTILKMLRENYPDFDGGKYGLKDKFNELQKEIDRTGVK